MARLCFQSGKTMGEVTAALDAALSRLIPRLHPDELDALRAQMSANHEIVITEVERGARLVSA